MSSHLSPLALLGYLECLTVSLGSSVSFDSPPSGQASPASRMSHQLDHQMYPSQSLLRELTESWHPHFLEKAT